MRSRVESIGMHWKNLKCPGSSKDCKLLPHHFLHEIYRGRFAKCSNIYNKSHCSGGLSAPEADPSSPLQQIALQHSKNKRFRRKRYENSLFCRSVDLKCAYFLGLEDIAVPRTYEIMDFCEAVIVFSYNSPAESINFWRKATSDCRRPRGREG